jgi:hypothetical protein
MPCFTVPGDRRFTVRGAIALDARESQATRLDRAILTGRFFREDDVHACLLSRDLAEQQRLKIGDTLKFLGVELQLVGILDQTEVDSQIVDISGKPLTPLAFYRPSLSVESPDHLLASETIFVPAALISKETPVPFPTFSTVIVPQRVTPQQIAQRVAELRQWLATSSDEALGTPIDRLLRASKGELDSDEAQRLMSFDSTAQGWDVLAKHNLERHAIKRIAEEIAADHANVDVFLSIPAAPWRSDIKDRVELISASARVSLRSSSFLILPFIVSFFMLLAIMMGNVYERRNEIHVFSSVGLAPRHVAGMFLAEALVYAGIASVLGYFLGIILLDVFRRAEWLPADFNPNYFGKVVIWSAVMATSSSLLSVLYPMHIASRMVNPSLERIWRIESKPMGNHWTISLPFVVNHHDELTGMLQFAREFLGHHYGERTGAFAIEMDPYFTQPAGLPVLHADIWLAPFERNLVQRISLLPRLDPEKNRYHFFLQTQRLSGPDYLWQKSNHAFVDGLRKQMLIWRSLQDEVVQEYIAAGNAALSQTDVPVLHAEGGPGA